MKITQFPENIVGESWHYRYSIWRDDDRGTDLDPDKGVIDCSCAFSRGTIDNYKRNYNSKEVYVSTNGQGTERD